MPPDRMIGGILFLSYLFVCLSVCLSDIWNYFLVFEIHFLILEDQFLILENEFLILENDF